MPTDRDIINLVLRLYDDRIGADPSAWDALCTQDGSYSALKRVDGVDVLIWRGSTTVLDWVEDLDDCAQMVDTPDLGGVHPGFIVGVRAVQSYWDGVLSSNSIICGHSLGAGHAAIYGAHLAAIGRPPQKVVLFGCPRPGAQKLADILRPVPISSYRNQAKDGSAHDLVTNVPFKIPEIDPYVQPGTFTAVTDVPPKNDPWGIFRWHHPQLYGGALATLFGAA